MTSKTISTTEDTPSDSISIYSIYTPSDKKISKRRRNDMTEEEGIATLIGHSSKKKKLEVNVEACKESRQKILDFMSHQLKTR